VSYGLCVSCGSVARADVFIQLSPPPDQRLSGHRPLLTAHSPPPIAHSHLGRRTTPQTSLDRDFRIGLARAFGGAIFIAVAQTLFQNGMIDQLKSDNLGIDPNIFINSGASEIKDVLAGLGRLDALDAVLEAYMTGLRNTYYISVACAACAFLCTLGMEFKSVKHGPDGKKKEAAVPVMA
jgi:hypothetical protein